MNKIFSFESIEQREHIFWASCKIYSQHPVFQGHFPGKPVLPGAVMLQMIKELICVKLDSQVQFEKVSQIKFLKMICPEENLEIELQIVEKKQQYSAEIRLQNELCLKADFSIKLV